MKKLAVLIAVVAALGAFYYLGGAEYLLPKTYQALYAERPALTVAIFFGIYVLVTALSIPGAALMTLAAGAIFGLVTGTIVVSFASSIGATLAFLISRTLLRDWVQSKFGSYLGAINRGVEKDGAFYLFTLRLVPVFPFFVINLLMGLTPIRWFVYYLVSQLGMLPATVVYVNAGSQLGNVDELSVQGILQPQLIGAFALLGIFPFIVKGAVSWLSSRREEASQ